MTFVLPSLPDIAPVTASLRHHVWKYDGEIVAMVAFEVHAQLFANNDISCNVIFRPAHSCPSFPVNSYLLLLRSISSGMIINLTVDFNETKLVLGPQDGLEDNQKYVYTITAINSIGISTSEERNLGKCFYV